MIIFAPIIEHVQKDITIPRFDGVKMSLTDFLNWENSVEAGIKYEWNDGVLEATERLKFKEQKIVDNLLTRFSRSSAYDKGDRLMVEVECYLPEINSIKIPDICLLTREQIKRCQEPDTNQVPKFIIEIISPSNSGIEIAKKNRAYFSSGVQVVWNIFPDPEEVIIYYSEKEILKKTDIDICDAGISIPDFQISVNDIFR